MSHTEYFSYGLIVHDIILGDSKYSFKTLCIILIKTHLICLLHPKYTYLSI